MGTKNNPGNFDCHAAAEDDEPLFTLLGRDPLAPFLVEMWAEMRSGNPRAVHNLADQMITHHSHRYRADPDTEKAAEADACAAAMHRWRAGERPVREIAAPVEDLTGHNPLSCRKMDCALCDVAPAPAVCKCGDAACRQCDTIALERGFIHEGP